jgi:hypothetical protein
MNLEKFEDKDNWDKEHIDRAKRILEGPGIDNVRKWNSIVYWSVLILAILGNFLVNAALIPIFITLDTYAVILTLIVVGLSFGLLFTHILRDLELVDPRHHVIAGVFLPIFAGIVSYVTVRLSNSLAIATQTDLLLTQSTVLIPIVYILAFTLPYMFSIKNKLFF